MAQAYLSTPLFADDENSDRAPLNRYPQMMQRYFVEQLRQFDEAREERLEKILTSYGCRGLCRVGAQQDS